MTDPAVTTAGVTTAGVTALRSFAVAACAALVLLGTAACGGGSNAQCGVDGCTITFPRSGDAAVSVLGVSARLVGVDAGQATIQVAGNTVTVPVGGEQQAQGFTVGVESVTDTEVRVRVRPGGQGR